MIIPLTCHRIACHGVSQKKRDSRKSSTVNRLSLSRKLCCHNFYNYLIRTHLTLSQNHPSKEGVGFSCQPSLEVAF